MVYEHVLYFDKNSPKDILDKIQGLDSDCQVTISPFDNYQEDYFDYEEQYQAIISNKDYYHSFETEINNIRRLIELDIKDQELFKRQLYISAIGSLEAFLSEALI